MNRSDYNQAREDHAWRLKKEGLTYKQIGQRLGVGQYHARMMANAGRAAEQVEIRPTRR